MPIVVVVWIGHLPPDEVGHEVILEAPLTRHPARDLEQPRFGILGHGPGPEGAVVPMIALHELVEPQRIRRPCGEHQPGALGLVHEERLAAAATAHLERLASADEGVVAGIEREQHPHAAGGIGAQHDDVAVPRGAHLHAGAVPAPVLAVMVERDADRRVVGGNRRRHGRSEDERQYQGE